MLKDLVAAGRSSTRRTSNGSTVRPGIDLGADGPTEIAWSVLSEILAVRRGAERDFWCTGKGRPSFGGYGESEVA